jgi:hypothetical protein
VGKKMVDRHSQTTDDFSATRFFCHPFRFDRNGNGETTKEKELTTASFEKSISLVATRVGDCGG